MPPELGSLRTGIELRREWIVSTDHLYNPSGRPGHAVLSSPSMIMEMETTCARLVRTELPESQTTVGFHVDVKHVASARPDAVVTTVAKLMAIDGNKLTFSVEAYEGERLIGTGRHRRAVISVERLG